MATQRTIAIIGAMEEPAQEAIQALSGKGYRLLLFYKQTQNRPAIVTSDLAGTIEWIECPIEASWEADAVILAVDAEQHPAVAYSIKEVTTGKPVIEIRYRATQAAVLEELLPNSIVLSSCTEKLDLLIKQIFH